MAAEGPQLSEGSSAEDNWELLEDNNEGEDEEFYEKIEAPKFVDFRVPNHYHPDDRYWFCLRVGCDQKHEEEMDSEAIYKQFVLRVMAARSPNVKLQKALNRNVSGKVGKCPLSAPPKPSKSRLPRLAIISSLSKRIGDDVQKAKPQAKVSNTPKAKGKQVPSKYLTTPSYKKCPPNPRSFQSVRKPKSPTQIEPRKRIVAKALTFQSPRKVLNLKKPVELHNSVTKLCEGMKNLEITSQRKRNLAFSSKTYKPVGNNSQKSPPTSSARKRVQKSEKSRSKMPLQLSTQDNQDAKSTRSIKHQNKDRNSCHLTESVPSESSLIEINLELGTVDHAASASCTHSSSEAAKEVDSAIKEVLPRTDDIDLSTNASEVAPNEASNSSSINMGGDEIPRFPVSDKENEDIVENEKEYTGTVKVEFVSQVTQSDDKENDSAFDENRCVNNHSNQRGIQALGVQSSERKKDTPNADKNCKGSAAVRAPGMKVMKPKPTNPKPFKLRTDERGILKETNSGRKNDVLTPQKELSTLSRPKDGDLQGQDADIHKESRATTTEKTSQQHRVRKVPTSVKSHVSNLQNVKPLNSTRCHDHLKNDLRKSTFSSRMHSIAAKLTPVKQVGPSTEIPLGRKLNMDGSGRALLKQQVL